jgi:NADPH:quinone reductase-like Zn-dependent oxidoreductase
MKTAEIQQFGIDSLTLVDRPEPTAGQGQVVVRMRAASLNFRDMMVVKGTYNPRMKMPMVPLSDGAGEVVEVGSDVTRVRLGDRVAGSFMQTWIDGEVDESKARSALGGSIDGVAAEYVLFDEDGLVRFPDHLSFEEAATLPCAAVTAWNALVSTGHLRPNETVLIQGSGGVSLFALQIAQIMRASVIATSSSDDKLERLKQMGAESLINYRVEPDWEKRVRDITKGRGVDHIVEVGGAQTLPRSMKAARMGGTISVIGVLSGAAEINFIPVFMRTLRLQGIYVGSREMFEDMNRAFGLHKIKPVIDRVFPWTDLKDALRYMESGAHFGKICLNFGS